MNESFQRITTWAKAHPALSVGIVAVPVIVGYMVYKKVGVSGGLSATGAEGDTSGLTTGGGGGSALEDLLGGGSGTPDPSYFIGGSVPEAMSFAIPTSAYAMTPTAFAVTPAISRGSQNPEAWQGCDQRRGSQNPEAWQGCDQRRGSQNPEAWRCDQRESPGKRFENCNPSTICPDPGSAYPGLCYRPDLTSNHFTESGPGCALTDPYLD
jgi:hypothetical protein